MNKEKILEQTRIYVLSAMEGNDPAHDSYHIQRVLAITDLLLEKYPQADPFRTRMLALLHDMNDDKLNSNMGMPVLEEFLQKADLLQEDIRFLVAGIEKISFRKYPKLSKEIPLEIRIVQDADRIDAMGAVGIARTFAYGGAKGRPLSDSLAHFDEKLLRLYDLLSTEEGKRLAKPRHDFLQAFYRQFYEEIE
ncbi:MAG: HD domain-containing protein [Oscillospiraceae bacterium]|nr:HD domain-containing protein [Oscillospiraceae bacterium]